MVRLFRYFGLMTLSIYPLFLFGCWQNPSNGLSLWQFPSQTGMQMMGYAIETSRGELIIIDGGRPQDAGFVARFINEHGGKVSAWFITHPHIDHVGALAKLVGREDVPIIETIYGAFPDETWIKKHCKSYRIRDYQFAVKQLKDHHRIISPVHVGQRITIDDLEILVLGINNPEITHNPINNSSVVLKMTDNPASILFLVDLGEAGGRKILKSPLKAHLKADYVQMAHHGQNGVSKRFYQAVRPTTCLWPTPQWLWDNNKGKGYNTGPWQTITVRKWMEDLGVQHHFVAADGFEKIR